MQDVESANLAGAVLSDESDARSTRGPGDSTAGMADGVGDPTGGYLFFVSTLNAARIGDITARLLGTDLAERADPGVRDRYRRSHRPRAHRRHPLGRRRSPTASLKALRRCASRTGADFTDVRRALLGSPETDSYEREAI